MGRQVNRVPLDFGWPLNEVWEGYLTPERLHETPCPDCKNGYSPRAEYLHDLWYGNAPFKPEFNGSTPFDIYTPAVRARAERNVANAPEFYGNGEVAVDREADRLARLFNGAWSHHLAQQDVDALIAADRLWDFTCTFSRESGWQKIEPPVAPTAEQVNEWSLRGFGHDSVNASVVVRARCKREGVDDTCQTCQGHATLEAYPGQRQDAERWAEEDHEPPLGEGWQLWETVSEGSPISPVFATAEELATWISTPGNRDWMPGAEALKFVHAGWAPTLVCHGDQVTPGAEFVAWIAPDDTTCEG